MGVLKSAWGCGTFLFIVVGGSVGWALVAPISKYSIFPGIEFRVPDPEPETDKAAIERLVARVNDRLPAMIDPATKLDRLSYNQKFNILDLHITLINETYRSAAEVKAYIPDLQERMQKHYDTDPDLKPVREGGVAAHYEFRDRQGKRLCTIRIEPPKK